MKNLHLLAVFICNCDKITYMKNSFNIVLAVLFAIGALAGYAAYKYPIQKGDNELLVQNTETQNEFSCPPQTPQGAQIMPGEPLPGKYQFVSDFTHDILRCDGNSWGGDFPGCDNWVTVPSTPWHEGDVVYSCAGLYEDRGPDIGWGIALSDDKANTRVPLKYVKKVPDSTPLTK